jgi:uncharacterized repeat protein (TIGR03803 family)
MRKTKQQRGWTSQICLGATSAALTLLVGLVVGLVATQAAQAQTYSVLYNFAGPPDGQFSYTGLVSDPQGNLYGTTSEGGAFNFGTVFKVSGTTETLLYSFTGKADGASPLAPLVRDAAGNLYGTTNAGGASGFGTVFKVKPNGSETVLHSFAGGTTDGCNPYGGLLRDKVGNLYGTTNKCGASNEGTVFKVNTSHKETVLHSFTGGTTDGGYPYLTSLLMDVKGNLYGVGQNGGTVGVGVVYKLSKSGKFTVLYSFTAGTHDGCYPYGSPAMDKAGNLYGTTNGCGASSLGTVWKLSKNGVETVLHSFTRSTTDGESPFAGVILDAHGNLYGDTLEGGTLGVGIVYKVSKTGVFTLLYSFNGTTGHYPYGGLLRDAAGNLYSTAFTGGSSGYAGVVWKLTP